MDRKQVLKEAQQRRKEKNEQKKKTYNEDPTNLDKVCRDFMKGRSDPNKSGCQRTNCRFIHDPKLCDRYWQNGGSCKFKHNCRKNHFVTQVEHNERVERAKRVERDGRSRRGDDLTTEFVDMNILIQNANSSHFPKKINQKDIVIVKDLFKDKSNFSHDLQKELDALEPKYKERVFQLWHNDCHSIANDRINWRDRVPTFNKIIEHLKNYFKVDVQATRLNIFNENQFKYYHRDRAAFDEETAQKQNFTICLNLGTSRTVAFRNVKTKTIISVPLEDGDIYCFAKIINENWEHAVLKNDSEELRKDPVLKNDSEELRKDQVLKNDSEELRKDPVPEKRISIVIWGKI